LPVVGRHSACGWRGRLRARASRARARPHRAHSRERGAEGARAGPEGILRAGLGREHAPRPRARDRRARGRRAVGRDATAAADRAPDPRRALGRGRGPGLDLLAVPSRRPGARQARRQRVASGQADRAGRRARPHGGLGLIPGRALMRATLRIAVGGLVLMSALRPAEAANYRWVDDDGVIHLTNRAPDRPAAAPDARVLAPSGASKPRDTGNRRTESAATEVMRLSGLDAQADLLAATIRGEFERRLRAGFTPAAGPATVAADVFSVNELRERMHQALARSLDGERARAVLAWLRGALSPRIVASETTWPTAERQVELTVFVNDLTARPPSATRLALIQRLERARDVEQGSALVLAAAGIALER